MSDVSFQPNQSGAIYGATPGISRNMQAEPSPLAGGDLNGTASTVILFSHAGTAASQIAVPRSLGNPNMGVAFPVVMVDFAVDYHPPAEPEPEGVEAEPEPEPIGEPVNVAPIGEAGEAVEPPIAAEPEPEPPPHHPKHKHKGRHV